MDRPRHLLVVVDPTAIRHPAVERARCLALAFAARVELFVCYQPQPDGDLRVDERVLERIANGLREQGIETTTSESSSPAIHVGIVEKVRQCVPALLIKDAHPHSLLRRTLLPNTDWQLLRTCPAPLLFVRDTACAQMRKVAAAVDIALPGEKPALLDRLLLSTAETFALALKSELHAVHAWLPLVEPALAHAANSPPTSRLETTDSGDAAQARMRLDELLRGHPVSNDRRHLLRGSPGDTLVEFVRQQEIDLLVMGVYSRGWMYNVLVGSTTERLLDRLPCDVLVMKP